VLKETGRCRQKNERSEASNSPTKYRATTAIATLGNQHQPGVMPESLLTAAQAISHYAEFPNIPSTGFDPLYFLLHFDKDSRCAHVHTVVSQGAAIGDWNDDM
jgi:hypothetical protein